MNKQRKLRLCFIGDISNVHCKRWANYFVDRGHEVNFIDDHGYSYKNLKLHYLKNCTGIKLFDYVMRILRIKSIVKKIDPDIVHSQQVTYHGFLGALSDMHPFIITPWGSDILSGYNKSFFSRLIIRYVFDKADVIHYIDKSVIDRVEKIYGDTKNKEFLLNEGVDVDIFRKSKNKKENGAVILSARIPSKAYNTLLLLKALNIVINEYGHKNIKAIMCGKGDSIYSDHSYEREIKKLVDKYTLGRYIEFFKWTRDVHYTKNLMEKADVYVDTMHKSVNGQGTGKTALEAMSSELAVVMPDNPGVEIYVKHMHNGIIYKKNDARALAEALAVLIKNPKLIQELGKNGRKLVAENLDWNKNMRAMESKYYETARKFGRLHKD